MLRGQGDHTPKQRVIRFSRPSSRVLFANSAVISNHEGVPTLMVRFANERHNVISNATAKL